MSDRPKNVPEYVLDWDDGRMFGDAILVTLAQGYCYHGPDSGAHVEVFNTVRDARKGINSKSVHACSCARCKGEPEPVIKLD